MGLIASVNQDGVKLSFPSPKGPKAQFATEAQMAKLEFKRRKKNGDDLAALGGEHWRGIDVRFACAVKVDQDQINVLLASIFETAEFLKCVAAMTETATHRLASALIGERGHDAESSPARVLRPGWGRAGQAADPDEHQDQREDEEGQGERPAQLPSGLSLRSSSIRILI